MKKTNNFKRIIGLLAAITIIFSLMAAPAFAGTASESKNSVVAVIGDSFMGKNGLLQTPQGSGFAIGKVGKPVEYIVTNNHVVRGEWHDTATVAFDLASNEYVKASICAYDVDKDIAVLKLPQPTDKRKALVICPMKYVDPDDTFAALGYPADQATDWAKYNMDDITITKGGIKKADVVEKRDVYMLDLYITHGNSGGPLVNSKGEVVGINAFDIGDNNYALAIDELIKVINTSQLDIALSMHNSYLWVIIVAAAALVLIIVLVIVLILRKKNSGAVTDYTPPVPPVPVNSTVAKENPAPAAPSARVIAIGGTLNGKRFTVTGTARLGRDASKCAIAFPVATQGVSAVHCEISFNGSVCYVKDLGSSYGTYTVDGKKLLPNAAQILNSGDKFYLASPENTFEVRF